MFNLFHIMVILWCFTPTRGLRSVPQYARDVSEHCKRRDALPSVFLSRRVMDADAQVLHFSRLDVPYSCFTTVRTEPGHSIIMVVELSPGESQEEFCTNGYQLGVFEYTETFGGYWGPIPDAVLKQDPKDPVYTKQYTLATKPTTRVIPRTTESTLRIPKTTSSTSSRPTAVTQDFITIEVPLVNLSATLVPMETQDQKPFDVDEFFDLFYDVVPRPGQPYKTSILPLVQIAVKEQEGLRKGDGEPRYELDYAVGPFTPDHRLTTPGRPATSTHINTNRNSNRWKKKKLQDKRVEPNTNNSPRTREPVESRKLKEYSLPTTNHRPSNDVIFPQAIENKHEDAKEKEPFNLVDDVIKSLNESGGLKPQEQSNDSDVFTIFNKWDNSYRNLSVYLDPYPNITEIAFRGTTESVLSSKSQDVLENTNNISSVLAYNTNSYEKQQILEHPDDEIEVESLTKEGRRMSTVEMDTVTFLPLTTESSETTSSLIIGASSSPSFETSVHENQEKRSSLGATDPLTDDVLIPAITTERSLSGTLVDHESWENVVQSAPVMAGLLNQHGSELLKPQSKRSLRRRRHISAIMVDDARPHRRVTTSLPTQQASAFNAIDMHEFARLIELPDDQMNNHVTIKMNPETSTQLFDMCSAYNRTKTRFLVVFNSSRIILSIENFTMAHVMVALTTARPLALLEPQCPENLVECQVEGTRLCIDSTNACDGIPNCGSAYAYDEDRVLCGEIDRQHSVYLAAATCLAVLVTMLYITHYWLRICVPKVAEAFFVYYDSADNELYLDSIMRSPMDTDRDQYMYNSALFDEENMLYSHDTRKSTNIFLRAFSFFHKINLFKQRRSSTELEVHGAGRSLSKDVPRSNSFTESELLSMMSDGRDQEVQTGESLEMAYLKVINSLKERESDKRPTRQRLPSVHNDVLRDLLKVKLSSSLDTSLESPSPPGRSAVLAPQPGLEEKEIHSTLYDPGTSKTSKPEKIKFSGTGAKRGRKCLRFNEHATFIPRDDEEDDDPTEMEELSTGKRSHKKNVDNNSEHGGSDFRNFFRKKKDHK
ncbi:uncharacterized protein LOC133521802 isoform X2 [Cydia pomonella]|uniref:uncharacterized protein LOC133521802 isoform X2 n=1 Tax=Cydia pomonella TaxID=82600 RepID=UPI002ADE3060|nr:uncharacterized protein LOC133521802 isoform X2 [Cydia pomonella]